MRAKYILSIAGICPMFYSVGCYSAKANKGADTRPNILFCIADDASFHHFSKSGCSWVSTPNFDRVANEGIFFNRCYTPNAKSAPSRAILLTGMYSWQLGEAGNHICNFPKDIKVFTEVLQESGYDVAFTGKGWAPGNPGIIDGKERALTGIPYQQYKTEPPAKGINKCNYSENFKAFLNDNNGEKPWFFWFGCTEPHRRYEYGSGVAKGGHKLSDIDEVPAFWPDNEVVRNDMLDYGYEIEYFDTQIGKMIQELESRDMLDNTLIVITSDNGMPFPRCKANDYEYSTHMPCAMMWKNGIINPGRTVSSYISFIDFAPTFLELAEVDSKSCGMKQVSGKSIVDFMEDCPSTKEIKRRKEIILGRERDDYGRPNNQGYPMRAIISGNMLLIWNLKPELYPAGNPETGYMDVDGSPTKTSILNMNREDHDSRLYHYSFGLRPEYELYDLSRDPYCVNNLAADVNFADVLNALENKLKIQLTKHDDPRMTGDGNIFDSYPFDTPEKWNFYERVMSGEIKEPWKQTNWINPTDYEIYPDNMQEQNMSK